MKQFDLCIGVGGSVCCLLVQVRIGKKTSEESDVLN